MREHRLIEQIITPLETELTHISQENTAHLSFIYNAVDFFKTYVDKYHHGKEEEILFSELSKKNLDSEHSRIMTELEAEHSYERQTVGNLVISMEKWSQGDIQSLANISDNLRKLIELYPRHIEKEDKHFFFSCQDYFTKNERENLLQAGTNFNQSFMSLNYEERMNTLLQHL